MKNNANRKVVIGCLIMLAVAIGYSGLLIVGLLVGMLATIIATVEDFTVLGKDEESNGEEL